MRGQKHATSLSLPAVARAKTTSTAKSMATTKTVAATKSAATTKSAVKKTKGATAEATPSASSSAAKKTASVVAAASPAPVATGKLARHLLAATEPKKIPPAIPVKELPRLVMTATSTPFDDDLMTGLLRVLIAGTLGDDPLRGIVRAETSLESRDALALALLRFWEGKEFHGRYDWVLDGVFALGGDQAILLLASYMAKWPSQSDTGRKRTIRSVPALVDTGTDTALLALCGLRQTAVVPSVLEAVIDGLGRAVETRNTTLSELLDTITPTLGLDAHGRRAFDYGSRRFTVMFDDHFEPHLRDEAAGIVSKELPTLESSDDVSLAGHAQAAWASLSTQLREAVRVQSFRLEQDMVNGRRWDAATWARCLRDHPLLVSFTRRIVWGLYDKDDHLVGAFRTAEDRTLVDRGDSELALPADARIGVLHPIHLDDGARAEWGTHFADYEIIQPFPQLGRVIHRVLPEEMTTADGASAPTMVTRYASTRFKSGYLRDVLVKKGWERDPAFLRQFYQRTFGHDGVVAIATMSPGVSAGSASYDDADQTIPTIEFRKKRGRGKSREPMPLSEVPAVALSEALLDLADVLVEQETNDDRPDES